MRNIPKMPDGVDTYSATRDERESHQFSEKFSRGLGAQPELLTDLQVRYYGVIVLQHGSSDPYQSDGSRTVSYPPGKCKLCQRKQRDWSVPTTVRCTVIQHINGDILDWSFENLRGVCKDCANGV